MQVLPKHVAIIMDGNGRWAEQRGKPRHFGHRAGVETVREIIEVAGDSGVQVLTLFAFSSENWRRPKSEVGLLMELFLTALTKEARRLVKGNVRLQVIGDVAAFPDKLQKKIQEAESMTAANDGLLLQIAANYGGRWDVTQSAREIARLVQSGELSIEDIDEAQVAAHLSFAGVVDPDLFIRTGGEQRISNFLLWQCAYSELYFTDVFWPDFRKQDFLNALEDFSRRQRRFGRTAKQALKTENSSC